MQTRRLKHTQNGKGNLLGCCSIVEHRIEKRETQHEEEEDIRFELWKENERNHWYETEKKELQESISRLIELVFDRAVWF